MCLMCQALDSNQPFDVHTDTALTDGGVQTSLTAASQPVYSLDQIADYLTEGFWLGRGQQPRSFDVQAGGTITVNITGLDALGKATALQALDAWSTVTGLTFTQSSNAMISFDDTQSGAYNSSITSGTTILSSSVNVHTSWQAYGDYYLQTFIHEIGHALGLGHAGNYNGSADFGTQAHFANDSWQMTVMSYFSNNENPNVLASFAYLATAQLADILAIQNLYGTPANVQTGNTIYGDNTNLSQHGMGLDNGKAVAIFDSAGTDTIDLSSRTSNQRIDLYAERFSDINGKTGNLAIARGTVIENAFTGSGSDHITGNAADNMLMAGAGDDTLLGEGGNDTLVGGDGADTLTGGTGGDVFVYTAASEAGDTITDFSLAQGDRIDISALFAAIGYAGTNPISDCKVWLSAATGGAWLMVNAVAMAFLAGVSASADLATMLDVESVPVGPDPDAYDTRITLTNSFVLTWTEAASIIRDTNGGIDTLDLSAVTYGNKIDLNGGITGMLGSKKITIEPGTEIENLLLGTGRDTGIGNDLDNRIEGGAGDDKLYGNAGADTLNGGDGKDSLYGGDGSDTITGDAGMDKIYGGSGDDSIEGGADNDKIYGEDGDDHIDGGDGRDTLYGGSGNDSLDAGTGDDKLYGHAGDDSLTGGAGRDSLYGDVGDDVLDGGADDDKLYGGDGNDTLTGGDGKDSIKADKGDDLANAGAGDDKVYGGDGDDDLSGGTGNDTLYGDNGDDLLDGGAGNDKLYGKNDEDTMFGGEGLDYIKGDKGDDYADGGAGNDKIYGDNGNDTLLGGDGDDYIKGGNDSDAMDGGSGIDKLYGDAGNDLIDGGAGNDIIDGGAGNDVIAGGPGADTIKGGSGTDTFVFNAVSDAGDLLYDFSLRYGEKIQVSGLLSGGTVADALSEGLFWLEAEGRNAWLVFDDNGTEVDLALIRNLAATTELTTDWLI
ncbi:M10 family metallopeptidase [Seohaeicola zhoushanensis]|uniref:Peptidase metallopeptidase domain-containing protein n=1 Tax=Seohaeicola zhoushanensis TaxID=1569283 RepID=A0A8J3GZN6_9RHOB|nr:M10 family metallopeptidase [Seohaeicola zhoushanensis]GHF59393.1 hypothetical protein GCM10017056_33710 [Seohaeicola zhoushanensis]